MPTAVIDGSLQVTKFSCAPLAEIGPHALGFTYFFDAETEGDAYSVTVRFEGRRTGVKHRLGPADRFERVTTVSPVLPGSGRITVTECATDLAPGEWRVTARPVMERTANPSGGGSSRAQTSRLAGGTVVGHTIWGPVAQSRAPGVRLGAWPLLVGLGAVLAVGLQVALAGVIGLPALRLLLVSMVACLIGVAGAKAYYLVLHPEDRRLRALYAGMCIQGFVLAAAVTLAIGSWLVGVPVRAGLDITSPGLLFGMTVGRFGCFYGGCCSGRPTASRWGLWSSDRRVGTRRIPTQLLEAAMAAAIGATTLTTVLVAGSVPQPAGSLFVASVAAYTLGRQVLFPLRGLPRQTQYGRVSVMTVSAAVLVVDVIAAAWN